MTTLLAVLVATILLLLALLHVFWAFGGTWGSQAVLPTASEKAPVLMPGRGLTLLVALGLTCAATLVCARAGLFPLALPVWLPRYGVYALATVFTLRAIGERNYVGFLKKKRDTAFARNDTRYYSPLCVVIAGSCLAIALS